MREPLETYKGYNIYLANYYDDYGAWFQFHPYGFEHPSVQEDPEIYSYRSGSAKTIEECKTRIDEIEDEREDT